MTPQPSRVGRACPIQTLLLIADYVVTTKGLNEGHISWSVKINTAPQIGVGYVRLGVSDSNTLVGTYFGQSGSNNISIIIDEHQIVVRVGAVDIVVFPTIVVLDDLIVFDLILDGVNDQLIVHHNTELVHTYTLTTGISWYPVVAGNADVASVTMKTESRSDNTNSNAGTGAGLVLPKVGVNTPLKSIASTDSSITITENTDNIDLMQTPTTLLFSNTLSREITLTNENQTAEASGVQSCIAYATNIAFGDNYKFDVLFSTITFSDPVDSATAIGVVDNISTTNTEHLGLRSGELGIYLGLTGFIPLVGGVVGTFVPVSIANGDIINVHINVATKILEVSINGGSILDTIDISFLNHVRPAVNLFNGRGSATIQQTQTAEANTNSNAGVGEGLVLPKVGVDTPLKSLKTLGIATITSDADSVTIDVPPSALKFNNATKFVYANDTLLGTTALNNNDLSVSVDANSDAAFTVNAFSTGTHSCEFVLNTPPTNITSVRVGLSSVLTIPVFFGDSVEHFALGIRNDRIQLHNNNVLLHELTGLNVRKNSVIRVVLDADADTLAYHLDGVLINTASITPTSSWRFVTAGATNSQMLVTTRSDSQLDDKLVLMKHDATTATVDLTLSNNNNNTSTALNNSVHQWVVVERQISSGSYSWDITLDQISTVAGSIGGGIHNATPVGFVGGAVGSFGMHLGSSAFNLWAEGVQTEINGTFSNGTVINMHLDVDNLVFRAGINNGPILHTTAIPADQLWYITTNVRTADTPDSSCSVSLPYMTRDSKEAAMNQSVVDTLVAGTGVTLQRVGDKIIISSP